LFPSIPPYSNSLLPSSTSPYSSIYSPTSLLLHLSLLRLPLLLIYFPPQNLPSLFYSSSYLSSTSFPLFSPPRPLSTSPPSSFPLLPPVLLLLQQELRALTNIKRFGS
jgi:hypothetical protein